MFHVLDHADIVFSGNLSDATRYVIEHSSGKRLDEAIGSGVCILYSDAMHSLSEACRVFSRIGNGAGDS